MKQSYLASDGLYDYRGRIGKMLRGKIFTPIRTGRSRDGVMFRGDELRAYLVRFAWAFSTESALMNLTEELKEQYDAAEKLWASYKDKLTAFRSEVKNDVSSLEASARKTTEAVHRMTKAYGEVVAQLNSPEMLAAVANAERLATALGQLANLQSHKLVFSVAEQDRPGAGKTPEAPK